MGCGGEEAHSRPLSSATKRNFGHLGARVKKNGGYLDPQNYTTQHFVTDPYYIRKHKLRISHRLRVHMERDLEYFVKSGI